MSGKVVSEEPITNEMKQKAEEQILNNLKIVDYDTREFPVEVIVQKYLDGKNDDTNELFVPDYQRDMAWDDRRQSKFIESVMIGLPIPYVFVSDVGRGELDDIGEGRDVDSRLEIVDGSQRIRTLARFLTDDLKLSDLQKLPALNGFRFSDLPLSRQRRFNRQTIRMIELTEKADEDVRRDIFERINTGSVDLSDMEKRRGIQDGPFVQFLSLCAQDELFHELAPISDASIKRREREEFVLRFFAYLNQAEKFEREVYKFLDDYVRERNNDSALDVGQMQAEFEGMLRFVNKHFPDGFRKGPKHKRTPRIRFEAISVGTAMALRDNPSLEPKPVESWIRSKEFADLTTSDSSNSRPKLLRRIAFVKDRLLEA